jgi:hypothetical protein
MTDAILKILQSLIRPGGRPFLVAFTVVLTLLCIAALFMLWVWGKDERFNKAIKFGGLWIHFSGGKDDPSLAKAAATEPLRRYRKLLYIKVVHLSNRKVANTPFYTRLVDRLAEADRAVPVYDEALYYTLRQFPSVQPLQPDEDSSSGVVDARLLLPWADIESHPFAFRDPHTVELKATADSDTMCSVSHFLNGLQDANQNFCTFADADAESLRIVVDFSSIPGAADRVHFEEVQLISDGRIIKSDNVNFENCGDSVYMAQCKNATKGQLLQMNFSFKSWDAPQSN